MRTLRRKRGNQRCVYPNRPEVGRATRRTDGHISSRQNLTEERGIVSEVFVLVLRKICLVVDRVHTANRLARPAIHALRRVDVKRTRPLVED